MTPHPVRPTQPSSTPERRTPDARFSRPGPLSAVIDMLLRCVCVAVAVAVAARGAELSWSEVSASGSLPPSRTQAALGCDAENNRLIVFGGTGPRGDTWVFDIASGAWSEIDGDGPQRRFSMV